MAQPITLDVKGLAAGAVLLQALHASESLSRMPEIEIEVISRRPDLRADKLLGKEACVRIELKSGEPRFYHGHITHFARQGMRGRFHAYRFTVHPALWFLGRTSDCKVFQDKKVLDIVKGLLRDDHPFVKFEDRTSRDYRTWDYCVQYNETDLNFVTRLLEHEGIYFNFEYGDGQHTLVLRDDNTMHDPVAGYDKLPYFPNPGQAPTDIESIDEWTENSMVMPGRHASAHFDVLVPKPMHAKTTVKQAYDFGDAEMFDYSDHYSSKGDHDTFGTQYMADRLDEYHAAQQVHEASTRCPGVRCGSAWSLDKHPDAGQNTKYLVTASSVHAHLASIEGGAADVTPTWECRFTAIPFDQQFRPTRDTPKPRSYGPQTAIVQTDNDEDVTVDDHGRVKVQFHWDRYGKNNAASSCWVRVGQAWAGGGMGAVFIPRKGHEVIVNFLNGDLDQPIITGSVFNGANPLPFGTDSSPTQSGFVSRSFTGGAGNANMLRFDDTRGSEKFELHSEKDFVSHAENDMNLVAFNNMGLDAHNDQSMHAGNKRFVSVDKGEIHSVKDGGRTMSIAGGKGELRVVKPKRLTAVEAADTTITKKSMTIADDLWAMHTKDALTIADQSYGIKVGAAGYKLISDGPILMKGSRFAFTTNGNIEFSGKNFNRTVFETTDTVLGTNTSTNMGPASATQIGGVESYVNGRASSLYMGIAMSTALGLQLTNTLAGISNTILNMANTGVQMGITGLNLSMNGVSLDNNSIKVFSGGGAGSSSVAGGGASSAAMLSGGWGIAAMGGAAVGLVAGIAPIVSAIQQSDRAAKDVTAQKEKLTEEMRQALDKASQLNRVQDFDQKALFPGSLIDDQLNKTGEELMNDEAKRLNDPDAKLSVEERKSLSAINDANIAASKARAQAEKDAEEDRKAASDLMAPARDLGEVDDPPPGAPKPGKR